MSPLGKPLFHFTISQEEKDRFEALLSGQFDYAFKRGDVLKGTVVSFDANYAYVDIGAKTNAVLPLKELCERNAAFADELEVGQEYDFYILREENKDDQWMLSRRRVAVAHTWQQLQTMMDTEEQLECAVNAVVKGGVLVDVKGLRGFVPASHLRHRVNALEELIGEVLPLKILAIDPLKNNIILSHRKVMADQAQEQRKEMMATISVGAVKEGTVVRIADFGAFVDLGGVDGLLPLSQMSWRWVEHPSDVLAIGDKVKVEVIGLDAERNRISLSIKALSEDPWFTIADHFSYGAPAHGKITRIKQFGAFVEIIDGVEALLPAREMNDYEYREGKALVLGDVIDTFIAKFQPEERRVSLSFSDPSLMDDAAPQPAVEEDEA
jgi:ribosomal protein S1